MAGHARFFIFPDFNQIIEPSILTTAFYFLTGLGHQAVIVFFVLSGFLIAGSILDRVQDAHWSWVDYAVARLSRLWVVLIPSLFAVLFWDRLGIAVAPIGFYSGDLNSIYHSGPLEPGGASHTIGVFAANMFFLQTIVAPTFGSNGPLWSLSNEFWYYVIFPLGLFAGLSVGSGRRRMIFAVSALIICFLLPYSIVVLSLTWLFGAATALWWRRSTFVRKVSHPLVVGCFTTLFIAALVCSKLLHLSELSVDIVIGGLFALLISALIRMEIRRPTVRSPSLFLSSISYTMYLFHFPLFAFMAVSLLGQEKMRFAWPGFVVFLIFMIAGLAYSCLAYLAFERHTDWVRRRTHIAFEALRASAIWPRNMTDT